MSAENNQFNEGQHEESNKGLVVLGIVVIAIIVLLVIGLIIFKPKSGSTADKQPGTKTSKELLLQQQEETATAIGHIKNLSSEIQLLDKLQKDLILKSDIEPEKIAEFVKANKNYYDESSAYFEKFESFEYIKEENLTGYQLQKKRLYKTASALLDVIQRQKDYFGRLPITYPIAKEKAEISSGYGMRDHPILNKRRMHSGIDISGPVGTKVLATARGKVIESGEKGGYGYSCIIEHEAGFESQYSHMVRIVAKKGQWVKKGEVVGYIGNTGLSQAPHLHYEIHRNGKKYNPSFFIFEGLNFEEYKTVVELGSRKNTILSH